MNVFGFVQLGLMAAQAVMGLVHHAESTGAPGPSKKQLVAGLAKVGINTAMAAAKQPIPQELAESVDALVDQTIDQTVNWYNMIGAFQHTTPVMVAPVPPPSDPTKTQAFQELANGQAPSPQVGG